MLVPRMVSPFVPFPIFCPYDQWRPIGLSQFPENSDVKAKLEDVVSSSLPFISVWYCQRYLAWLAHSWRPEQATEAYYFETIHLERLLNWCFSQGLSLLDLKPLEIERYVAFFCNPPASWCLPSSSLKFVPNPLLNYGAWPINQYWRPFLSASRDVSRQLGFAQIVINRFYKFYYQDVSVLEFEPALAGLFAKHKPNFIKMTEFEMDWYMNSLAHLPYGEKYKLITMVYFALARYSRNSRRRLMGSTRSPGLLNQFYRNSAGEWIETLPGGSSRALGGQFKQIFEQYLMHLELDPEKPLPPVRLFATSPEGKFARKCRVNLVEFAMGTGDPRVRKAVEKYQSLSFSTLRKSSITTPRG